jgi:rRNA maturation endonuclease Nob1
MSKINVMDTSFLMQYPDYVKSKKKTEDVFIIPDVVIRELDLLKNAPDREKAGRARKASRAILEAQNRGKAVVIDKYSGNTDTLSSKTDNRVIDAAVELKKKGYDVVLHTTDVLMGVVAGSHGIEVKTRGKLPLSDYILTIVVISIWTVSIGALFESIIAGILTFAILFPFMMWSLIRGSGLAGESTSSNSYHSVGSDSEFHSSLLNHNDDDHNPCLAFMAGNIYHSQYILRITRDRWDSHSSSAFHDW